jgi:hypothetical protein
VAGSASFFPLHPSQIENGAPSSWLRSGGTIYLMLPKSDQLLQPPALLEGVLETADGKAAYSFSAMVVHGFAEKK